MEFDLVMGEERIRVVADIEKDFWDGDVFKKGLQCCSAGCRRCREGGRAEGVDVDKVDVVVWFGKDLYD